MEKASLRLNKENNINEFVNPDDAKLLMRNLHHAIDAIEKLSDELSNIKIDANTNISITLLKPKFSKYVLMGSDCSLEKENSEILHTLSQIDMCYKVLLCKTSYTIGDVIYMINTLSNAKVFFEHKLEDVCELLQP